MFRYLGMLRKNVLLSRFAYTNCILRANLVSSTTMRCKGATVAPSSRITVSDINVYDLAKGDLEFTRNFLTTLAGFSRGTPAEPEVVTEPQSPEASGTVDVGGSGTTILDRDGMPIVPIEIDGWKNAYEDDEDGPTVQNSEQHIEIGNDNEYKKENMLVVPEKREGHFEYKGIKVKLPENAFKDVGTYRFRRDQEDLDTVADDMRVVKFDKK